MTSVEHHVSTGALLGDADARAAIEQRLGATLFVEAGAGSGKTAALVARVVHLVRSGTCPVGELAVITFTEAAATELRARVRAALGDALRLSPSEPERRRLRDALVQLEGAAISTIHGFCRRLLAEHAVEAGLPPRFAVLDEVRQSLAWRAEWSSLLDRLAEAEDAARLFGTAADIGVTPRHLEDLAAEVAEHWDVWDEEAPDVVNVLAGAEEAVRHGTDLVLASLDAALALEAACLDPGDALLARLAGGRELRDLLAEAAAEATTAAASIAGACTHDAEARNLHGGTGGLGAHEASPGGGLFGGADPRLVLLAAPVPSLRAGGTGQQEAWACDVEEVRRRLGEAGEARQAAVASVADKVLPALVTIFAFAARRAADERRAAGRLLYHDLLVRARDLLLASPEVLASVQRRFHCVLIDEFQDTDPLQLEIAELVAGRAGPLDSGLESGGEDPYREGRLFVVGDPQQSIYRFRGADVAAYEGARDRLVSGATISLTSNFRSVPGILEFANECLGPLLGEHTPLQAARPPGATSSPVRLVGGELDRALRRRDQRVVESHAVAGVLRRAVGRSGAPWLVEDEGELRPARLGDVAILVPRRTGLDELEAALEEGGIGYRVESASLLYRSQEVRDLLALCRAIEDPADQVALLATLRSPAFACRDDELLAFRQSGGRWSLDEPGGDVGADGSASIVAESIRTLRRYRDRRFELGPVGVLELAVRERRLLQLSAGSARERECWRRVRFLVERARAFVESGGGGLGEFADWVDEQLSEGLRSAESVLPEPDEDVAHVLTVHAAKGLEYPIVILASFGTTDEVPRMRRKILRTPEGKVEVHLRGDLRTAGFEAVRAREEALDREEAARVLYVAATRARDHLVVCVHHVKGNGEGTLGQRLLEAAEEALERRPGLWERIEVGGRDESQPVDGRAPAAMAGRQHVMSQPALFDIAAHEPPRATPAEAVGEWRAWEHRRGELLATIRRPSSVRASEIASLVASQRSVLEGRSAPSEEEAVSGGGADEMFPAAPVEARSGIRREGTQLGRAVHGTLAAVSLEAARRVAAGDGSSSELGAAALVEAGREGIEDRAGEVEALALACLSSPTVRAAFAPESRPRREVYVATTVGGVVLDGYVDLCFVEDGALTVVDYKTDPEASVIPHRLQLAAYALALEDATGLPVRRCVLVFPAVPAGPIELEVADLSAATSAVRSALGA